MQGGNRQPHIMEIIKMEQITRIEVIGQMDNSDGTFESANRVYGVNGISPTIPTCGGVEYNQKY